AGLDKKRPFDAQEFGHVPEHVRCCRNAQRAVYFGKTLTDPASGCQHRRELARERRMEKSIRRGPQVLQSDTQQSFCFSRLAAGRHDATFRAPTEPGERSERIRLREVDELV